AVHEPRRPADLPRRTADEAGPDEHGRVRREPRALPRPPPRRNRGNDTVAREAALLADEGPVTRCSKRPRAARDPRAQEDGLPGTDQRVAARQVLARR